MTKQAFLLLFYLLLSIAMHLEYSKKDRIIINGKVWNKKDGEVISCSKMNSDFDVIYENLNRNYCGLVQW